MKASRSPVWGPCIGAGVALIALGAVFGLPLARGSVSKQKLNAARKLLEKIKLVDGEGSGLDADTVRGKTLTDVPSFQVVDSAGRALGILASFGTAGTNVLRRDGGAVIGLDVSRNGIGSVGFAFFHETANCSDTRYLSGDLIREAWVPLDPTTGDRGKTAYYATDPLGPHTLLAYEIDNGTVSLPVRINADCPRILLFSGVLPIYLGGWSRGDV